MYSEETKTVVVWLKIRKHDITECLPKKDLALWFD